MSEGKPGLPEKNLGQFLIVLEKPKRRRNTFARHNEGRRLMSKRGRFHVYLTRIPDKSIRYVRDLWHTLENMRWRWLVITVALVNISAYLLFGSLFLLDAWISGDFDGIDDHRTCINGVNNFTSFFMLGIETITTTGYGYFHPTEFCQLVSVILTLSTLVTIFIDGAFISVVYVKISRPSHRASLSTFSKKAVIALRNGRLCLVFRVHDSHGKHWISNRIHLYLVEERATADGVFPAYITELPLASPGTPFWPQEVVHEIDEASPLWRLSAKDLMVANFELLVVMSGSSILTGQSSKSQTSYLSGEILWGHWFSPCMDFDLEKMEYVVHKKTFHKTHSYDTPLCSAQDLRAIGLQMHKKRFSLNCDKISK